MVLGRASLVAQMVKIHPQYKRPGFDPWIRNILWRMEWLGTPVFLPGECHGQRSLGDCIHWIAKNWMELSYQHFRFHGIREHSDFILSYVAVQLPSASY